MKLQHRLEKLTEKARPYIPFTILNTIWRSFDKQGQSILDVGCGNGWAMAFINRQKRFYTVGVDAFKPYLTYAKEQLIHDDYVLCDIRKLPVKRKSFDIVMCLEVLEHLEKEDGRLLLEELEAIAKRQVIISSPVGRFPQHPEVGDDPYMEHKSPWQPGELRSCGYRIRGYGLPLVGGAHGLLSRLPQPFSSVRRFVWILASSISYFAPELAGWMVCVKRLRESK